MIRLEYERTIPIAVAVAVAGLLMAGTPFRHKLGRVLPIVHASGSCSNSSLRGNFGFQFKGSIIGLGPIAGVGVTTYDGAGKFTGTDNINVNGFPVLSLAESGTYSVNADCTGIQTVNQADGNVVHTTFVIVGKQVFQVQTDPGAVVTAVSRPVGAPEED